MKSKAVRLHGKNDLRLDEFELPEMQEDEIEAHIYSDSICMSSYKTVLQGADHKRVHHDVAENPAIIGHEFSGVLTKVGKKWADKFREGQKFIMQTALNYKGTLYAPGYSYPYCGGCATDIIIPKEVMLMDCLIPYEGDAYYYGSLCEPLSCIIGSFHATYHTTQGKYIHTMDIKPGGKLALLGGAGPMGLATIDYAIHRHIHPAKMIVTDFNSERLERAKRLLPPEEAAKRGIELTYLNPGHSDPTEQLLAFSEGTGFDEVMVYAPDSSLVEQGDRILGKDGCLNVFAGAVDQKFSANLNCYNLHYGATHMMGTTGGNTDDMKEALTMIQNGLLTPSILITHIGGLDAAAEATSNLPNIPGGKKLIYTNISMPLTAIEDLGKSDDPVLQKLGELCEANGGLWSPEAEKYLLAHAKAI